MMRRRLVPPFSRWRADEYRRLSIYRDAEYASPYFHDDMSPASRRRAMMPEVIDDQYFTPHAIRLAPISPRAYINGHRATDAIYLPGQYICDGCARAIDDYCRDFACQ